MEIYCGTDIIEVDRIKRAINRNKKFKTNIFSKLEIEEIEKISNEEVKYQRYAGRFAAKEAIYKAISKFTIELGYVARFLDVEIVNDKQLKHRPKVNILSKELEKIFMQYNVKIDLSISHIKGNAIAMTVVSMDKE